MTINLGSFEVPKFDGISAAFGAEIRQYPVMKDIPKQHQDGNSPECRIASKLFYAGGSLGEHGRKIKAGVEPGEFYAALRSYLSSFAPQHEHKVATCGWLIDQCTVKA